MELIDFSSLGSGLRVKLNLVIAVEIFYLFLEVIDEPFRALCAYTKLLLDDLYKEAGLLVVELSVNVEGVAAYRYELRREVLESKKRKWHPLTLDFCLLVHDVENIKLFLNIHVLYIQKMILRIEIFLGVCKFEI